MNYVSSTSLDIALKLPSSERRKIVLLMDSVQISPCGFFFANTRRVDVSKFLVENTADFDTPATKTDIVTFLENQRLFARTTYITLLIYLKAIYGQKMKEIAYSTLAMAT